MVCLWFLAYHGDVSPLEKKVENTGQWWVLSTNVSKFATKISCFLGCIIYPPKQRILAKSSHKQKKNGLDLEPNLENILLQSRIVYMMLATSEIKLPFQGTLCRNEKRGTMRQESLALSFFKWSHSDASTHPSELANASRERGHMRIKRFLRNNGPWGGDNGRGMYNQYQE